jgi:hypothetical protein
LDSVSWVLGLDSGTAVKIECMENVLPTRNKRKTKATMSNQKQQMSSTGQV